MRELEDVLRAARRCWRSAAEVGYYGDGFVTEDDGAGNLVVRYFSAEDEVPF